MVASLIWHTTSVESSYLQCFSQSRKSKSFDHNFHHLLPRVVIELENLEKSRNLKETSKSQGIYLKSHGVCDRIPEVRGKSGNSVL